MLYHWFYGVGVLTVGFIFLRFDKRQERLDPLSPEFGGSKALDELGEEMKKEEQQRKKSER
jgi:hypothetical protein